MPDVPKDHLATVVFNRRNEMYAQQLACETLGYVVAGVYETKQSWNFADILVERSFTEHFPEWVEAMKKPDSKIYDLELGPLALLLRNAISPHEAIWRNHDSFEHIP